MNQNARFFALIAIVAVVIGGLWFVIRGRTPATPTGTTPTTSSKEPAKTRETASAPEPVGGTRKSLLTATQSRSTPRDDTKKTPRTGIYAVRGLVVTEQDQIPVEGAEISLTWRQLRARVPQPDEEPGWKTRTSNKGMFRVDKLPVGSYLIVAQKDELAGVSWASINPREIEDFVTQIELKPVGTISGRVVNDKQEPIGGALVALGRGKSGQRDLYGGAVQAKSDDDGRFELNYVEKGEWSLAATADHYAVTEVNGIASDAKDLQIVLKPGGSVSGTVIAAESGKPLPNVTVHLSGGSNLNQKEAISDTNGKFAVPDLADGPYQLDIPEQPQILASAAPAIKIENANHVDGIELKVVMGGVVTGKAFDAETGAPVVGATLRASGGSGGRSRDGVADEDGIYRIEGLTAGQYTIQRLWMAGYRHGEDRENKFVTVKLGEEVTGIDFAIPPGLYLRGRVVDKSGEPIPQVDVTSVGIDIDQEGESMVSDEQGRWVHRGFSPNTKVRITASKPGYSAAPLEGIQIGATDKNDVEIVMDTGGSIEGTVVAKDGTPLPDVYVMAIPAGGGSPDQQSQTAYSRDLGKFKVQGLAPGTYKMQVRPPRAWREMPPVGNDIQISKGENITGVKLVVDFDTGAKIAGHVVDSTGKPVRDANVNAQMNNGQSYGYAQSDADGKFEILGLSPGIHRLYVNAQNFSSYQDESVEAPNPNLKITLRGKGFIEGRVLEAKSGQPVKSFSIVAMHGDVGRVDPGNFWGGNSSAFSDEQGKFRVDGDEGIVSLYVQATGYAPTVQKVDNVKEGQTVSGIEVRMDTGGVVEGVVTNKAGERVAGSNIYVGRMPMDWERGQRPAAATTDTNGEFRVESLPAGEVRLFAMHADYATASAAASVSASGAPAKVQIVLGSGGQIKGTIRVAGKPASGGFGVSLYYPELQGGFQQNAQAGSDGTYTFNGLPEGEAMLNVYGTQPGLTRRQIVKKASVSADQVTTVDFDIVPGTAVLEGLVTNEGQPVSGVYVNVSVRTDSENREGANTQTDAKGAYRFDGLPIGTANVSVQNNNSGQMQMRTQVVQLEDNQTTRADFDFATGTKIAGKATGIPKGWVGSAVLVSGAVSLPQGDNLQGMYAELQDRVAGATQVSSEGNFQIEGAQPGEYTVIVDVMDPQSGGQVHKQGAAPVTVSESGEANVSVTVQ